MKAALGIDLGSPELTERLGDTLRRVEELLIAELSSGEDFLTEIATHLAKAGGKRFRPMVAALAAECGPDSDSDDVVTAATVCELIHLATLYHDDVMDEAPVRRGVESANARWSNSAAILAGDFLFARASRLVSTLGPNAVRIIAETFAELVTGQMRETVGATPSADPVAHYLKVVWEKTGSLVAASARFGGLASGADPDLVERLARVGDNMGIAFQISDDIIDIGSPTEDSGKTPGTDLKEGVHTLPVLLALREEGPQADRLRELLVGPVTDDAVLAEALALLRASDGMVQARGVLADYAARAHADIAQLPDGPAREAFTRLVSFTTDRTG